MCERDNRETVKEGIHCGVCGERLEGTAYPGADVYHGECIMKATEHLRNDRK